MQIGNYYGAPLALALELVAQRPVMFVKVISPGTKVKLEKAR